MSTDHMSIYERIQAGHFETDMHYPNRRSYNKGEEGEVSFRKAQKKFRQLEGDKLNEFKKATLHDVGLENHPNKDAIYNYAWQEGHSSGLYEIYNYLCEISELFFKNGKMLNAHVSSDGTCMIP